jgi:hypothetical protein
MREAPPDEPKSSNELIGLGSRGELERETTGVRIVAIVAFSVAIVTLFFAFGFLGVTSRLFLLTIGHLIIAPVAGYASVRFGLAILVALGLVVIQTLLDVGQLLIRVFTFSLFDFFALFYIVVMLVFVALDIVYLITLWRLYTTIRAINRRAAKNIDETADPAEALERAREHLLQQESNTIRVAALFGLVGAAFLLLPMALLFVFSATVTRLALLTFLHVPVAIYALMFSTRHTILALILLGLAALLLVADVFVILARLSSPEFGFAVFAIGTIVNLVLLMIGVLFVLVDVVYMIASVGLVYARNVDNPFAGGSLLASSVLKQSAASVGDTVYSKVNAAVLGNRKQD